MNERIRVTEVLLVEDDGTTHRLSTEKALEMAKEQELDLIEVSPKANPPVVKIGDFGQYLYQLQKQAKKQRAHTKQTEVKTLRFGFRTDTHDLQRLIDRSKGFLEEALSGLRKKLKKQKKSQKTIPQVRDQVVLQIEKIMENGLEDSFREMTPIQKQEFKIEGEKAAIEIRTLLRSTRVKIKKVFQILLSWLSLLPGINNFFLEQEAKIKADKIMAIRDHITTKR